MSSNNIGIGIENPLEKLHINGGLLLHNSDSSSNTNGTIRWTGTEFQGRKGNTWQSLTSIGIKGDTGNQGIPGFSGSNGVPGAPGADGANGPAGLQGETGPSLNGCLTLTNVSHDKPNGSMRFSDDKFQLKIDDAWYVLPLGKKIDTTAPTTYSVNTFTLDGDNATFTMAGAETGTALAYTISSSGGGTNVTGNVAGSSDCCDSSISPTAIG